MRRIPARPLPDALQQLEEVFEHGERGRETRAGVVLLHQPIHLPLPHLGRVLVYLVEYGPEEEW